jgi:hypothetical protein
MKKKVSHSEITTYVDCQKKWELQYVKGLKVDNIHFQFGSMAHKVMETRQIPDEELYQDLKEAFGITSWKNYFESILEELDERMSDYEILHQEYRVESEEMVGVIDVVWKHKETGRYLITDYKFSNSDKGQVDILLDEQMYIYAVIFATMNGITLDEIDIGYINIPKTEMNSPRTLKNGQLSKDKAQNTTHKRYLEKIKELGLDETKYEDILLELKSKHLLTIETSPINQDMAYRIMTNIDNIIKDMQKGYVLEKCSYMCKRCECLDYCKYGKEIRCERV